MIQYPGGGRAQMSQGDKIGRSSEVCPHRFVARSCEAGKIGAPTCGGLRRWSADRLPNHRSYRTTECGARLAQPVNVARTCRVSNARRCGRLAVTSVHMIVLQRPTLRLHARHRSGEPCMPVSGKREGVAHTESVPRAFILDRYQITPPHEQRPVRWCVPARAMKDAPGYAQPTAQVPPEPRGEGCTAGALS